MHFEDNKKKHKINIKPNSHVPNHISHYTQYSIFNWLPNRHSDRLRFIQSITAKNIPFATYVHTYMNAFGWLVVRHGVKRRTAKTFKIFS